MENIIKNTKEIRKSSEKWGECNLEYTFPKSIAQIILSIAEAAIPTPFNVLCSGAGTADSRKD